MPVEPQMRNSTESRYFDSLQPQNHSVTQNVDCNRDRKCWFSRSTARAVSILLDEGGSRALDDD